MTLKESQLEFESYFRRSFGYEPRKIPVNDRLYNEDYPYVKTATNDAWCLWNYKPTFNYLNTEIAIEVALQIGDKREDLPRAESRWLLTDITKKIIESNIITKDTLDIDEVIASWIANNVENGELK
jgi:hypothetical protein